MPRFFTAAAPPLVGLIAFFLFIIQAAAWSAAPPAAGAPVRKTLASGLRVIVVERADSPLVALDLRVRAGTGAETAENNGVAHFIEHLVFKGTASRKPGEIDTAVESLGGELSGHTSRDWTRYATVVTASGWRDALGVMTDMVLNPAFRAEDLETERAVIQSEMDAAHFEPMRTGLAALNRIAYAVNDPYRLPLFGSRENVRRLSRDDLLAFWKTHYRPANMTLVVVGNVRADAVLEAAALLFPKPADAPDASDAAAASAAPETVPYPAIPFAGVVRGEPEGRRDRDLVTVLIAFPAPSVREANAATIVEVLLPILARGGGERGLLADALIRTHKKALSVSAEFVTPRRAPGLLVLGATGKRADAAVLETTLMNEVRRLIEDGVSEGDAEAARRSVLGSLSYEEETVEGLARRLAFYDALDAPDFAEQYRARVAAVHAAEINRALKTYLTPARRAVVFLGGRAEEAGETPPQ